LIHEGDTLVLLTDTTQRPRVKQRIDALLATLEKKHRD